MYKIDKEQREKLEKIQLFNVLNDKNLIDIMVEELGELIVESSKRGQNEFDKEHFLEELVGSMNTLYNVITHYYKTSEIDKMINKQINKCIKKYNIK